MKIQLALGKHNNKASIAGKQQRVGRMDTCSTVPLESQGSPAKFPALSLSELLQLPRDKLGACLFLGDLDQDESKVLGAGATSFKDWISGDFLESADSIMVVGDDNHLEKLSRVYEITRGLVKEAKAKAEACVQFATVGYGRVKATAEEAVAKVVQLAGAEKDAGTRKQKIQIAEQWLQREIATLDKKSQDYASVASRSASFAASKVHSLIGHLRDVNLLSASFMSLMESWQELDACHAAACKLKPKQIDAYADTQVVV